MNKIYFFISVCICMLLFTSCKDKSVSLSIVVSKWNSLVQKMETVKNIEKQINGLDDFSLFKSRASEAKEYIKTSMDEINNQPKEEDEQEMYDALQNCMVTYDSILDVYKEFAAKSEAKELTEQDVEIGYSKLEPLFKQFDKQSDQLDNVLRDYARKNGITNYAI